MLKLRFRYRFEAAHRFFVGPSIPCRTPHGHSWYATLTVAFMGESLDQNAMALPFEKLKKDWKALVDTTLDHSFFHHHQDPLVPALLKVHPEARLLPFPGDPTTELLGLLLFEKMQTIFSRLDDKRLVQVHEILVEETPTNSIAISKEFYELSRSTYKESDGWWNKPDVNDRSFKKIH